ncbi:MAG: acyl-CoA desaturase [Phycisphaerales bacterium]
MNVSAASPRAAEPAPAVAAPVAAPMSPADRRVRLLNMGTVITPFVVLIIAVALAWGWGTGFNWIQFGIFLFMVEATALGVCVGFHRLFTHRAFKTVAPIKYALGALGSMSVQGTLLEWAAIHRRHHQHSDEPDDPHSPHAHPHAAAVDARYTDDDETSLRSWGRGLVSTFRGFRHAHYGWLFIGRHKGLGRYVKDLAADPVTMKVNRHFRFWVLAGLVIPAVLGGLLEWSLYGALLGLLWGGFVRILFVHHITWSVNSVCHLWGTRPFNCHDQSRNNALVGVFALGEGWHNNHHAFPTSARHGLRWWEIDLSYLFIRTLGVLGLATDIKVPTRERIAAKARN